MRGRAYDVTGPELLTIGQMVDVLSRVLGTPLQYVDVPEQASGEQMTKQGLSPTLVAALVETLGALRSSRFAYVADTVERLTGRRGGGGAEENDAREMKKKKTQSVRGGGEERGGRNLAQTLDARHAVQASDL